jgi:2'-5' RNA ligase
VRQDGCVALSVCLLPDQAGERAVRRLWTRLEESGVPTLLSHTHGRHLPHLTLASLTSYRLDALRPALTALPAADHLGTRVDALGSFRRSRVWLAPAVTSTLLERQTAVVAAAVRSGAAVHPHYRPGDWLPHVTLAPRLTLAQLPLVAARVNEVLPLTVVWTHTALVHTSTGDVELLG